MRRVITALAWLLALSACGDGAPSRPAPLKAYLSAEPASLNFVTQNDSNSQIIANLVGDPLVDFDHRLELVPRLAASWEVEADGRRVTFHLQPGVSWHDGRPLTADDAVFTLERVLDPASLAGGKRPYFETVTTYRAEDRLTFLVERDEAYARAVEVWETLPILPRHLYEGQDFLTAPANRAPVGTGPYRFVSWESGSRIELAANPDYFGGAAGIDRLVFRPLPDPSTRVEALLAGDLDLTSLRPLDRERILADPELAERVRIIAQDTLFVWYIAWNQDGSNPFFADARVRLAMTMALDRQGFVDEVLLGVGEVATSLVHPSMWAFHRELAPWGYDRRAAAELLDEAGWVDSDGDGLRDRGGDDFTFTLMVPAGNQEILRLAAILQESLRTLGVEMDLRTLEYNLYRAERDAGRFAAMAGGWLLDPDPDCYDFWHSSQRGGRGLNYAGYADAEVDRICEEARRITDRERRAALYRRVQEILHRDQPNTFIAYRQTLLGLSQRLAGVEPSPVGIWGAYPGPLAWRFDEVGNR
jgi:peptide/nickel transport system substrate-binding protein